jgi:hypothetical protein
MVVHNYTYLKLKIPGWKGGHHHRGQLRASLLLRVGLCCLSGCAHHPLCSRRPWPRRRKGADKRSSQGGGGARSTKHRRGGQNS